MSRMGRGVNGVRTYGTQSESFAFFYFCVSLYGNPVTKLCSFGFWTFGTHRTGGRSPRGSQSASPQPLPQKAPTNFNKFQQISTKSFASRRSLTAKSCRPIGNKKKPSTHAPTSHRTHTQAHTASCRRQLPSMLFSSRSISGIRNNKPVNHISGARVETRKSHLRFKS